MSIEVIGEKRTPRLKRIDNGKYYFVFQGKQTSKTFFAAKPFADGYAPVKAHSWSNWRYLDEDNKLSKDSFYYAEAYQNGYAVVQEEKNGRCRLRDENGNLSEMSFESISPMNKDRIAIVECDFDDEAKFRFFDGQNVSEDGYDEIVDVGGGYCAVLCDDNRYHLRENYSGKVKVTEEGFLHVENVSDGFAQVKVDTDKGSKWKIRNMEDGSMSDGFSKIIDSFEWDKEFVMVQVEEIETFCYVDRELKTSEIYENAQPYKEGFAMVIKDGKQYQRDMIGRTTETKTKSGEDFYKYYTGKLSLGKMSALHFVDEAFCEAILNYERKRIKQAGKLIFNSVLLSSEQKKKKYALLLDEMSEIETTVKEKREKAQEMIEARKAEDAKRREEERKKRAAEKADRDAFNEFIGKL